ncbi:MAG: redoxin domain-containing protein [Cyclobacteriaceae bacterium]|nr:redoxin domain-containing protein [Cyclobacteriaceae bacterium]
MKKLFIIVALMSFSLIVNGQILLNFELPDAISNNTIPVVKNNPKGVVIVFMSNKCPFTAYYIDRLKAIQKQYIDKGIEVVYVNSFYIGDETVEEMTVFGKGHDLSNYLADKDSKLKKTLGARKTPEAFLLKNKGGTFTQFYKGPIDNNAQVASDVKFHYLKNNIDNLLEGKSATKSTSPVMGCVIK